MKKVYDKQCTKSEGGKPMEDIISKLAEIEATASHIMEDCLLYTSYPYTW